VRRIFSIRVNVDDMSAQLDACDSDAERLQWLAGFRLGARGAAQGHGWPQHKIVGYELGLASYQEAETKVAKQSSNGVKSAHARRVKFGSAKPRACEPDVNHGSNGGSKVVRENANLSNNPIIQESSNPGIQESTSERTTFATPTDPIFDGMDSDKTEIVLATPVPLEPNWLDWRSQHGAVFVARRGEDGDSLAWERAFKLYGLECFDGMYYALKSTGKPVYFNLAMAWLEENTSERT
jgi:hypothetical protein